MAVEKLVSMICGGEVDFDPTYMEEFLPDRIWVLKKDNPIHSCGHLSYFAHGEDEYADFLCRPNDEPARLLGELGLSKLKGKMVFHRLEEGVEDIEDFKGVIKHLLDEIAFINRSPKVENKREKIELLVTHKLDGFKEKIE
jgi:hypothetical protein